MLLYFPLVFFLVSFYFVYRKNGFDMAAFILLVYSATSLASIFLAKSGSYYNENQLSTIPVLLHCFFTLALTYPFIVFNSNKKRAFKPILNQKLFNTISIIFIVIFFIQLIASFSLIMSRLSASEEELAAIRQLAYQGELETGASTSGIFHLIETIMGILGTGSMCMIVFFFYSLCFLNRSKLNNILLLVSSMISMIYSIITVDRSKFFFWILLFALSYFLFKPYLPRRQKRFLFSMMTPLLVLFTLYFIMVTVARFGSSDLTAEGSVLNYAGQSLFNVCILWDNVPGNSVDFRGVFPITYYILDVLFGIKLSFGVSVYKTMALSDLNGFNALLGYGVREVGQLLAVLLLLLLVAVLSAWIKKLSNAESLSLYSAMSIFLLGTIVICGFITYYYTSWPHALMFWLFVYLTKKIN